MLCLDTSFIIDLLNNSPAAIKKYNSVKNEDLASTEINYFEMLFGVFKKPQMPLEEMYLVQEFFNNLRFLSLDPTGAYKAAEAAGALAKKGADVGAYDSLIAGICLANNCRIITKNVKHFKRIEGLKVETY